MKAQAKLIALIMMLVMFSPFAIDFYISTLPTISEQFGQNGSLTLSAFMLALGIGQLFVGNIYDKHGPFKLVSVSIAVFTLTCITIYYCETFYQLLALRCIQGFATSGIALSALAMVKDNFTEKEGAKLYGYINSMMNVAPAVTPLIGAWIFELTGQWQILFIGLAIYGITVFPYLLASKDAPKWKDKTQLKADYSFFKNRKYQHYGIVSIFSLGTLMLYVTIVSPLTQNELGFSEYNFSFYFGFVGFSMLLSGIIFGKLVEKKPLEYLFCVGQLIVATAVLLSAISLVYAHFILGAFLFFCTGFIFLIASSTSLMLSEFTEDTGKAVSIVSAFQMILGAILGASVGFSSLTLSQSFLLVLVLYLSTTVYARLASK
ncbi:MFS transporter [Alteromonas macleodii]|uniref:MFS transporter n=1 Tax=Alteromonas macleodii TaxID=28108 RepID=UPI002076A0CC|nr:MFS transporter [Alteromonas macleodii]USI27213.1 MFS transporter [Alteromonas macleodii]